MSVARVAAVLQGALFLLGHAPWNTHGHGAVTHPRPRNGIDRNLPPWSLPMSQSNPNPKGVGQGICPAPDANGTVSGFNGQVPLPFRLSRSSSLDLFCITQPLWQCPPDESMRLRPLQVTLLISMHVHAAFTQLQHCNNCWFHTTLTSAMRATLTPMYCTELLLVQQRLCDRV